MANKMPLGSLARSRKDWTFETHRCGAQSQSGTANNLNDNFYLCNTATDGTWLAVWSIRGWCRMPTPLMIAGIISGTRGSPNTTDFQLAPGFPTIPGYTTQDHNVSPIGGSSSAPNSLYFIADGIHPFTNGDAPLFLIAPGFSCCVSTWSTLFLLPQTHPAWCQFIWGPYQTPALINSAPKALPPLPVPQIPVSKAG